MVASQKLLRSKQEQPIKFLITLLKRDGYSTVVRVLCVAAKEVGGNEKTLENLYYGNITPSEQQMAPGSEMEKAVARIASYEKQLMEQLGEAEQETLTKLIRSQHEINGITATENFILGFRLGARLMVECMDENDGDIRNGGG